MQREVYKNTWDVFVKTLQHEGIRGKLSTITSNELGLYKGLGVQLFGVLPAQVAYISTLEWTKYAMRRLDTPIIFGNLVSGACASFMSTSIAVPVDVISQRQMIQGTGYHLSSLRYDGAWDAFRSIFRTEGPLFALSSYSYFSGIRGLYRGYGASILTYTPSSAIWWSMYSIYKNFFLSHIPHNSFLDGGIVAFSGVLACIDLQTPVLIGYSSYCRSCHTPSRRSENKITSSGAT